MLKLCSRIFLRKNWYLINDHTLWFWIHMHWDYNNSKTLKCNPQSFVRRKNVCSRRNMSLRFINSYLMPTRKILQRLCIRPNFWKLWSRLLLSIFRCLNHKEPKEIYLHSRKLLPRGKQRGDSLPCRYLFTKLRCFTCYSLPCLPSWINLQWK